MPISLQEFVVPPITLGILVGLYIGLPGSSLSGEYTKKKFSPIEKPLFSIKGLRISSVVPG